MPAVYTPAVTDSLTPLHRIAPIVVSAPFGNYIQPRGATPTLGTFTAADRPGRVWRILKTVRYYPRLGAWVNKIGLRNPGIDWLAKKANTGRVDLADKIVSIHGFTFEDWRVLLEKLAPLRPLAIELNMSCPNVGEVAWPETLFGDAAAAAEQYGTAVICKLPPINYQRMAGDAWDAGVRAFHACNTLPVPRGGMSGKPLQPLSLRCVADLRERFGEEAFLIGGGGVTCPDDVDQYLRTGADRVAIGTKAMNPRLLWTHRPLQAILDHAAATTTTTTTPKPTP